MLTLSRQPYRKLLQLVMGITVLSALSSFFFMKDGYGAEVLPPIRSVTSAESDARQDIQDGGLSGLLLKTISLSQGEGGVEIWRLKAEWADVRKEDDRIIVQDPKLTYFVEDGEPMQVTSALGDIEQKNQIIRFITNVRVSQEEKHLTGDLLIYLGETRTMTLPNGGTFLDAGINGTAQTFVWDIAHKILHADGNVNITFAHDETVEGQELTLPRSSKTTQVEAAKESVEFSAPDNEKKTP